MDSIMLVEDNPLDGMMIEDVFENAQIAATLFTVENAHDAIDVAQRREPVLVLVDLDLEDHGGWDTLCRLKKEPRTRDIPVWSMSSRDFEDAPVAAAGISFDEYLYKPIDTRELTRRVHQVIENAHKKGTSKAGPRQTTTTSV